jgi:hypothetical protein
VKTRSLNVSALPSFMSGKHWVSATPRTASARQTGALRQIANPRRDLRDECLVPIAGFSNAQVLPFLHFPLA